MRPKLRRNYNKGWVRFDDTLIGEWREGKFHLEGLGLEVKGRFEALVVEAMKRPE